MTELYFGATRLPPEVKLLRSQNEVISEGEVKGLIQAAQLHLEQRPKAAGCAFSAVAASSQCRELAAVYGGLLTLLQAARALPPSRRRAATLTAALRQIRVPDAWHAALVEAMCGPLPPTPAAPDVTAPVHWQLDIVINHSERGRILEPSVGLGIPSSSGETTYLQFPKAQFLRFRQEMAVMQREMESAESKAGIRPS
ncbi:COMM domain-containing protein 5-like [Pollicipes pollicipes]|uniref:COMM domain-containing protein 5-like n=1 Tax=Pollicipes pollicipes TaxID=41117 RepID=UPI00188525E0|nr:COMM domain-containing protein 5-like [Pollicipes pollicipes]XP_037087046.1 COMM domain-containing protein 5-like [Pollicipes pollicipes]